jgi:hypothetical protein
MSEKLCPVMAMANGIRKNAFAPWCVKEKCALWVEDVIVNDHSRCAIAKIATELMIISDKE